MCKIATLQERHAAGLEAALASYVDTPASLADLRLGCLVLQKKALAILVRCLPAWEASFVGENPWLACQGPWLLLTPGLPVCSAVNCLKPAVALRLAALPSLARP